VSAVHHAYCDALLALAQLLYIRQHGTAVALVPCRHRSVAMLCRVSVLFKRSLKRHVDNTYCTRALFALLSPCNRAAAKLITQEHPTWIVLGCAAHQLSLLLKDLGDLNQA
jgi:hypothetical protein